MKNLPKLEKVFQLVKKDLQSLQENERVILFGPERWQIEEQEVEVVRRKVDIFHVHRSTLFYVLKTAPLYALAAVSYQCELL